jgi:hypothetical protein
MTSGRYDSNDTAQFTTPAGKVIVYLRRRFVPQPESLALLREHVVNGHRRRLDQIAAAEIEDPEFFWQICDANRAMTAEELEVVGKRLRITLPAGIPAPRHD